MTLHTSYYGGLRKLNLPGATLVGISRTIPPYITEAYPNIQHELLMAPSSSLLSLYKNKGMTPDHYKKVYLNQLSVSRVLPLAREWAGMSTTVVLLCYEVPTAFCHRHILAEALRKYGIPITEYGV